MLKRIRELWSFYLWMAAGFLLGMLLVYGKQVINAEQLETLRIAWEQSLQASLSLGSFWGYLVWKRVRFYAILILVSMTRLGQWFRRVLCGYIGLSLGAYCMILLKQYKQKGILLFFLRFFPHGILLGFAFLFTLSQWFRAEKYQKRTSKTAQISCILLVLSCVLLGCYLEASVNPWLLRKYMG